MNDYESRAEKWLKNVKEKSVITFYDLGEVADTLLNALDELERYRLLNRAKNSEESVQKIKMKNFIILNCDNSFNIILHACPDARGVFQWYLYNDLDQGESRKIEGQTYESITLSSDAIVEKKLSGKWIGCHYEVNGIKSATELIYLSDSFVDMIRDNPFENVYIGNKMIKLEKEKVEKWEL